jgi:hypothetical protein
VEIAWAEESRLFGSDIEADTRDGAKSLLSHVIATHIFSAPHI